MKAEKRLAAKVLFKNIGTFFFTVLVCTFFIANPGMVFGDIIKGKVNDAKNNAPLEGVKVSLKKNPQVCTYTNASGEYTMDTQITGLIQTPDITMTNASLFTMLNSLGHTASLKVRNVKGALIGTISPGLQEKDFKRFFSKYPRGVYVLSVTIDSKVNHFWIFKSDNNSIFVQNTSGKNPGTTVLAHGPAVYEEYIVLYSKKGYRDTTMTVNGSQNNVDLRMDPAPNCGNGVVDPGEVCDGNNKPCNMTNPWKYAKGDAKCNGSCSGFDETGCVQHPVVNMTPLPHGDNHWKAAEITSKAQWNVIMRVKPGMIEKEIKDILDSVYKANNFSGYAFPHITGSGPNSCNLHYPGNSRKMVSGDVLLVDIGAMYGGYCADLTRTYPVNGKYTPRQREIYQLVLDAQRAAAAAMKPGVQSLSQMTTFVKSFFKKSPLRAKNKSGQECTMDVFFIHGLSHYIGKQVHGGDLGFSMGEPVKPGRLFSIEPGIYIDSEGFGVRIEDDYMMTDQGAVNIFPNTVVEIDQIEAMMASRPPLPESTATDTVGDDGNQAPNTHMDF